MRSFFETAAWKQPVILLIKNTPDFTTASSPETSSPHESTLEDDELDDDLDDSLSVSDSPCTAGGSRPAGITKGTAAALVMFTSFSGSLPPRACGVRGHQPARMERKTFS